MKIWHLLLPPTRSSSEDTLTILLRVADERHDADEPKSLLQARLEQLVRVDVAVTTELRSLVRASMDALRTSLGEAGWQAAVETVEPVVFAQLHKMVA